MEIKYRKVLETLKEEILRGKYSSGAAFPSKAMLIRRFGISNLTAVKVVSKLKDEGLVHSCQGCGTFVTKLGAVHKIGLILSGVVYSEFFQRLFCELERSCQRQGWSLEMKEISDSDPDERAKRAVEVAQELIDGGVSGVLFNPLENRNNFKTSRQIVDMFKRASIPVVLLNSGMNDGLEEEFDLDLVSTDDLKSGRLIGAHLVERGVKRIAFVARPEVQSVIEKYDGVCLAVRGSGSVVERFDFDPNCVAAVRRMWKGFHPKAIVCGNDTHAAWLKHSLTRIGVRIPDDVLLAGFDDLQHAMIMTPRLTSVHLYCEKIADIAVCRIIARIASPDLTPVQLKIGSRLVVRESTLCDKKIHTKENKK